MQLLSVLCVNLVSILLASDVLRPIGLETESMMARCLAAFFVAALVLGMVGCNSSTAPTCPPPTMTVFTPLPNPDSLRFYPHEVDYFGSHDLLYHGNYTIAYAQGRFHAHFREYWIAMRCTGRWSGALSITYVTLAPDTSQYEYLGVLKINTGGLHMTTEGEQRIHDLFFRRDLLPSSKINMLEGLLYKDPGMFRSIQSGVENRILTPVTSIRPGSEELQFLADMESGNGMARMSN